MASEETQHDSNGHSHLKWVWRGLAIFVGAVALALIAGKLWIVPLAIEYRIAAQVGRFCYGDVRVQNTRLGYDGQVTAGDVIVSDSQGRPCIRVTDLRLHFNGMANLNPRVSKATVGTVQVDLYRDREPLIKESRPPSDDEPHLQELVVEKITVRMHAEEEAVAWIDGAHLTATRTEHFYDVSLNHDSNLPGEAFRIAGTVDPRSDELQLDVRIERVLDANQVSVLLSWANLPSHSSGHGRLDVEMQFRGSYADLADLTADGYANFTDAVLFYLGAPVLSELSILCDIGDGYFRGRLDGRMLEGTLNGTLNLEHAGLTMVQSRLSLEADGVDLGQLASNVPDWTSFTQGIASGYYDATFKQPMLNDVNGAGALYVKGIDVQLVPVVWQILEVMKVVDIDVLGPSDAMVRFGNQGPALTINDGSVANSVTAIKIERGGKVDLRERHVDLYAVWVPLKQAESLLAKLPLADLLMDLKNKLIRVHVQGNWNQSASELVSKEPLEDVSEAVGGFFKDVAKAGGHISKEMFDALKSIGD